MTPESEYRIVRDLCDGLKRGATVYQRLRGLMSTFNIASWRYLLSQRHLFKSVANLFESNVQLFDLYCAIEANGDGYNQWKLLAQKYGVAFMLIKHFEGLLFSDDNHTAAHVLSHIEKLDKKKNRYASNQKELNRRRILRRVHKDDAPVRARLLLKNGISMHEISASNPNYDVYSRYPWPTDNKLKCNMLIEREHGVQGTILEILEDLTYTGRTQVLVRWFSPDAALQDQYHNEWHPESQLLDMKKMFPFGVYTFRRLEHEINAIVTAKSDGPSRLVKVVDKSQKSLTVKSKKKYIGSLRAIARLGNISDMDADIGHWIRDSVDDLMVLLHEKYPSSYNNYCSPIVTLARINTQFMDWLTRPVFNIWATNVHRGIGAAIELSECRKAKFRTIHWETFVRIVESAHNYEITPPFERPNYASDEYILLSLYIERTLRDDYGQLRVSFTNPRNEFEFSKHNWIWTQATVATVFLNEYKTVSAYGMIQFDLRSHFLVTAIKQSIRLNPRLYLLNSAPNTLSKCLFRYLGPTPDPLNATHLRKARVTYERSRYKGDQHASERLATEMLHTVKTADIYYNHPLPPFDIVPSEDASLQAVRSQKLNSEIKKNRKKYVITRIFRVPHMSVDLYYEAMHKKEMITWSQ